MTRPEFFSHEERLRKRRRPKRLLIETEDLHDLHHVGGREIVGENERVIAKIDARRRGIGIPHKVRALGADGDRVFIRKNPGERMVRNSVKVFSRVACDRFAGGGVCLRTQDHKIHAVRKIADRPDAGGLSVCRRLQYLASFGVGYYAGVSHAEGGKVRGGGDQNIPVFQKSDDRKLPVREIIGAHQRGKNIMLYFIFRKATRLHGKNPGNPALTARARTVDADLRQSGLLIQKSIVFFGERLFAEEGFDPDFFFRRHRDGRFCVGEKKGKTEKKIQNARHYQNDGKEREETAARLMASHAKISFFRNPTRFFLCLIVPGYEKNNKKRRFFQGLLWERNKNFSP